MREDQSFQGLVLSLGLHLLLFWLALSFLPQSETLQPREEQVEVEYIQNPRDKSRSFVSELGRDTLLKDLKDKADFFSQYNRRVREQMVAKQTGKTQNRTGEAPFESDEARSHGINGDSLGAPGRPGEKAFGPGVPLGQGGSGPFGKQVVVGASTLGEYIPGVKEGSFTALNTDRFTFYTFYNRLNEQLRSRWVQRIRNYTDGLGPEGLKQLAEMERITQVEVLLTPKGQLIRTLVHKSSGDRSVDDAAVLAFQDAAPFPNPPQGMVQEDGIIHLHYGFVVQWSPTRVMVTR